MRNESSAAIRQQAVPFYFKSRHSMLRSQSMAFGRTRWIGAREVVPKEVLEEKLSHREVRQGQIILGFLELWRAAFPQRAAMHNRSFSAIR